MKVEKKNKVEMIEKKKLVGGERREKNRKDEPEHCSRRKERKR